jgi:zinc and cadmium transporter
MSNLWLVILFSLIGGVFSLVGGILLLVNKKRAYKIVRYAAPFAAGALLAAAFVDMLPESLEEGGDAHSMMFFAMCGLLFFFLLEGVMHWFHHHSYKHTAAEKKAERLQPVVPMIILGDTIHNFIDGVAIAAGFLISPASGIIVTLAVAAHEIPQEIGDFAILLDNGIKRGKVLLANALSALASTVSAIIFYILGSNAEISLAPLIAIVAGFFIYIATTDIIPTIHQDSNKKDVLKKMIWLIIGVAVVSFMIIKLHSVIDEYSGNEHSHEHSLHEDQHSHEDEEHSDEEDEHEED